VIGSRAFAAAIVTTGVGALALVPLGIGCEERASGLTRDIPDWMARGALRLKRLHTRGPGLAGEAGHHRRALTRRSSASR
jgi:hypothetical protein